MYFFISLNKVLLSFTIRATQFKRILYIQMEIRSKKPQTNSFTRTHSSQRLKFKEIPLTNNNFNELNSKYELYKQGTANVYAEDLESLKARNVKGQVGTLQLPAIDYIISQMSLTDKEKSINHRNFDMYPSLLKTGNGRYKDMLSEKQQVKDFIIWFETQYQNIENSEDSLVKKFHDKQTLIAAGFTEMTSQVARISKNRAEILKMLWNRENGQVANVIEALNGQGIKKERSLLQQITGIHCQYQDQIEHLKKNSDELQQRYKKQTEFSRACVKDLRILRKRIKKLEYMSRKLGQVNGNVRRQNLHLMEENIKLLANIKDISKEQAVVLHYRKMQLYQQRQHLKKYNYKQLLALTHSDAEQSLTPLHDLEEKKNNLFQFYTERVKEHPEEKLLIKDQYFTDEDDDQSTIEIYFKNVINRPNVQIQLLNETDPIPNTRDKGINTEQQETPEKAFTINLEKGVQVQMRQSHWSKSYDSSEGERSERRIYHLIDQKEEENKEKESKMRIIQHRISRKNSLALLQMQSMGEKCSRFNDKKNAPVSNFAKKVNTSSRNVSYLGTNLDIKEQDPLEASQTSFKSSQSDGQQIQSVSEKSVGILTIDITNDNELIGLKLRPTKAAVVRKSFQFKEMLKNISQDCHNSAPTTPEYERTIMITLDGEEQETIKQSQLDDLISKYLQNNPKSGTTHSPEKSLGKLLNSLFKNVWNKSSVNLKFQLLDMIRQSYGNGKSVIWKFLNVVSMIKQNHSNPLLKVISILLNVNDRYSQYSLVNTAQLADIYFHLFAQLSIKSINDSGFSIWKACTTMDKVRTVDFMRVVEEFFSDKKRRYIEAKITELLALSQNELTDKKASHFSSSKRIQIVSQDHSIIKLNPLILYIMEVYLIEKQMHFASYSPLIGFITQNGLIPLQVFLWLLELLSFSEEIQTKIIAFALPSTSRQSSPRQSQVQSAKPLSGLKADMFYRCCVKFDFPIMQQLSVSTFSQFKLLPIEIQQRYYRMIEMQEWMDIKGILLSRYQEICESDIYLRAFQLVAQRLESQIRKGTSIYGQYREEKIKQKEEVFSLLYKLLIVEAHRKLIRKDPREKSWQYCVSH